MPDWTLIPYAPEWAERWDAFVMEQSQNGTFLQTRRFLGYHLPDRFADASLMIAGKNGELLAAVPAARCEADAELRFRAHPGSTFGGLVLSKRIVQAEPMLRIVDMLDAHVAKQYAACELSVTPEIFAQAPTALLEYALFNRGYRQETSVACFLPLSGMDLEILRAGYSATKRYELRRCERAGLAARPLQTEEELAAFYSVLCLNMRKFDAEPLHTLSELADFLFVRLQEEVRFLGVYDPAGAMVAGACLFYFRQANVLHTQYLAVDTGISAYAPSAFLYDTVIRTGLELGADKLSFGTSTFDHGRVLNRGLIQNKEGFGCMHTLNRIFTKRYA